VTSREVYEARREAVAAAITQNPEQFNMGQWVELTACGTTYCMAGWAAVVAQAQGVVLPFSFPTYTAGIDVWAEEWLGLVPERGSMFAYHSLFYARAPHQSPEDAALALKSAPYRKGIE